MERRQAGGGVRTRRTSDQDENIGIGEDFAPSSIIGRGIVEEYGGAIDAAPRLVLADDGADRILVVRRARVTRSASAARAPLVISLGIHGPPVAEMGPRRSRPLDAAAAERFPAAAVPGVWRTITRAVCNPRCRRRQRRAAGHRRARDVASESRFPSARRCGYDPASNGVWP